MNKGNNFEAVKAAVWDNPKPLFGFDFEPPRGNTRQSAAGTTRKDRLILKRLGSGLYVHYNGSQYTSADLFDFARDSLNLAGAGTPFETMKAIADIYGLQLTFSPAEQKRIDRGRLVRACTEALLEYARTHQSGAAFDYITKTRGLEYDGHLAELSTESLKAMKQSLRAHRVPFEEEDLKDLGLTDYNARLGFNCVLPYFADGHPVGFVLRNTQPDAERRYNYSKGLGRPGYCDHLKAGTPLHGEQAIFVEGQFDALRLIQAGFTNVIAIGGKSIGEELAELLQRKRITDVVYIPDYELTDTGERERSNYREALAKFRAATADGEPLIKRLFVADLPTALEDLNGKKIDADSWGKEYGNEALKGVLAQKTPAWRFELEQIPTTSSREAVQDEVEAIYKSLTYPPELEDFKRYFATDDAAQLWGAYGLTGNSLKNWDTLRQNRVYSQQLSALSADLNAAAQKGASPEAVLKIAADLNRAASGSARDDWQRQINKPFEEVLAEAAHQPDAMKTGWQLGNTGEKDGKATFYPYGFISFTPGDVSIICAPTSHGKTTFLIQAALNLLQAVENADKVFLYISSEENERQLFERAFNTYLDIPTTEKGTEEKTAAPCFKKGWRKTAIKEALRSRTGEDLPDDTPLQRRIYGELDAYGEKIAPRLKLIHTEASAESITANIEHFVHQYRARGVEVGAIFYDYIQLLTTDTRSYSRQDELKAICKALKDCAGRIDCPLIAAAQLNRDTLKTDKGAGIDNITLANIGEAADIERIAHDVYLLWQCSRTPQNSFLAETQNALTQQKQINPAKLGERSQRIFRKPPGATEYKLASGFIYLEQMKARDGRSGGWGLFPFDGEAGKIGTQNAIDTTNGEPQLWN